MIRSLLLLVYTWLLIVPLLQLQQHCHEIHAFTPPITTTSAKFIGQNHRYDSIIRSRYMSQGSSSKESTTATTPIAIASESMEQQQQQSSLSSEQPITYTYFSPCKINLFLRILRKRPSDGYHDLASLFQAIGFGDTLTMIPIDSIADTDADTVDTQQLQQQQKQDTFTCNMEGVPTDSTNLVLRAIQLMRNKTAAATKASTKYFHIHLHKECPAQAGLGGGSANAATAMYAYNEIMGQPASMDEMVEWSGELGSDITFFLSRGTAYCTGRGEIMNEIDPPPFVASEARKTTTKVCIVKLRNVGLSTPTVFKALDYNKLSNIDPDTILLPAFLNAPDGNVGNVAKEYYINDLEYPAFQCIPQLQILKDQLLSVDGFTHVMMSGSGTSIFCIGTPNDMEQFNTMFCVDRNDLQIYFSEFINRPKDGWYERP